MTRRELLRQRMRLRIARAKAIWSDMRERQDARKRAEIVIKRVRRSHFRQYGRFIVTGIANTAVDLAILNILFFLYVQATGLSVSEGWYAGFKAISFSAAVANSWFLNKNWVFASEAVMPEPKQTTGRDLTMFFLVSAFGFGVNVAASLVVFSGLQGMGLWSEAINANIGALCGTATALATNFIGYRLLVFKQNYEPNIPINRHSRI